MTDGTLVGEIGSLEAYERYDALFNALRREYTKRNMPLKGTFELTPHCTLDCKMCYVHASNGQYPGRVLTGDEWISIIDDAVDAGMLYATLTGGECMVHPDFRRIYEHLKKRGVFVSILSNGTLIDESMAVFLGSMPPHCIRISIYGSGPEGYERVTGSAEAFYKVDRAFDLLHEAGVVTDIAITVCRYNLEDFDNILRYANGKPHARLQVECDMIEPRSETGKKLADFALNLREQERVWHIYKEADGKPFLPLCDKDFDVSTMDSAKPSGENASARTKLPCAAGHCIFYVSYSGVMRPCVEFELVQRNLLNTEFGEAWMAINEAAKAYVRSEECQGCKFLGKCSFCAAIYSKLTGGKNGLPGSLPCDKRYRILRYAIAQKGKEQRSETA